MKKLILQLQERRRLDIVLLFFSFMYVQLVVLRCANSAGRGFLPDERQELVYCFLQIVVIAGFLLHAAVRPGAGEQKTPDHITACVLPVCAAGALILLFAPAASLFYLIATGVTVFLLGWTGGAVYLRLARLFWSAPRAGLCLGGGYSAAVALQFCTQLQWNAVPAAAVFLLLSFAYLAVSLTMKESRQEIAGNRENAPVPKLPLICAVVITAAFLIFTIYYTGYIHHLQISSGYGEYNVYAWPRLLLIPVMLLFGWLGGVKDGKLLAPGALCAAVAAFLNTVLTGRETYSLNMCLYYIALGAVIAYYHMVFLRLAPSTKRPALWACMGRLIDSAAVVFSFAVGYSSLSQAAILAVDIGMLVLVIVMMTLNKDFAVSVPAAEIPSPAAGPAPAETDPFSVLQERFSITPAEMKVLRELVLTEDKQDAIAARLNISVSTMRHHITSIYRKTSVQSRAGLCRLASSCES